MLALCLQIVSCCSLFALLPAAANSAQSTTSDLKASALNDGQGTGMKIEDLKLDVQSATLENGLTLVVLPNHRAPVVNHMIWYKVGSADEPAGQSGIAHFLEHLMFKGSQNFPDAAQSNFVAKHGGEENAFTSYDQTAFYQTVASEHLPQLMQMEADRMRNMLITPEQVATEKKVIIEERVQRVGNNPAQKLNEAVMAALYYAHPYRTPVIGWRHEIEALERQEIYDFYHHWYAPNNAIVMLSGDVSFAEAMRFAQQSYGKLEPEPQDLSRNRPLEPEQHAERRIELSDARVGATQILLRYLAPSYHKKSAERFDEQLNVAALEVLVEILGGDGNARLNRILVEENQESVAAGAYYDPVGLDYGSFVVYTVPAPGQSVAQAEQALNRELERVIDKGVTQKEVDTAISRMLIDLIYRQDSLTTLSRSIGRILSTGGEIDDVLHYPSILQAVSKEEVEQAAKIIFEPKNRVVAVMKPLEREES